MKISALALLLVVFQAAAADDPDAVVIGDWSEPVPNGEGATIRGRLLICDTPDHSSSETRIDTAVYLELQEFSKAISRVRVFAGINRMSLADDAPGLRCELRDSNGKLVPNSPGGFGGGAPLSTWVTLQPYCSVRLRASVFGGGRLDDGGLAIYLASRGWWDVSPITTNKYFLSGTFSAAAPTNAFGIVSVTNRDVWFGALKLPPVQIPLKKP